MATKIKDDGRKRQQFLLEKTSGYKAIVIGASAGGMTAMTRLFSYLPAGYQLPVIVAQHLHPTQGDKLFAHFNYKCALTVKEAWDKEPILPGHIYFAPANYHLLVEPDQTFSLSVDDKVNHSRPSIDVLFASAASVWPDSLVGIILTGASVDGARGLYRIRECGGLTIAQEPDTAEHSFMPKAAIDAGSVSIRLELDEIGAFLSNLSK